MWREPRILPEQDRVRTLCPNRVTVAEQNPFRTLCPNRVTKAEQNPVRTLCPSRVTKAEQNSVQTESSPNTLPEQSDKGRAELCPNRIQSEHSARAERPGFTGKDNLPASLDPITGVQSKDVEISPEIGLSARLYLPRITNPDDKLPLLIYFHGGGFIAESTFSPLYHNYLNSVVAKGNTVAVSVEYRLAPEHPLPAGYEDCWAAIKRVASHFSGGGPEAWLEDHADFRRVFFAGDSAGANIAHHMAIRVGWEETGGFRLAGVVLVHPYFWGKEPIGGEEGIPMEKRRFAEEL
ncbi:hypothetical protein RJ639_002178 [Escallonia herrerae]|uniref:Alpha/beta hydrolase fold-3 domain-containing protein n=1 Tax=Escallonia herrerae TaxID=1293975 RepID=A0AA89BS16_9ASTE|nr:hypothetical protein RJ639_002178 [Escallonia herrerae]